MFGQGGDDRLLGEAGVDTLVGGDGNDTLDGCAGDEYSSTNSSIGLFGGNGADVLRGGTGVDALNGEDGDDLIEGGVGNDFLWGGSANDRYRLSLGDGADVLNDESGVSTLVFGDGIGRDDVSVTRAGSSYYVRYSATDSVVMNAASFAAVTAVKFADGSTLDTNALRHQFQPAAILLPRAALTAPTPMPLTGGTARRWVAAWVTLPSMRLPDVRRLGGGGGLPSNCIEDTSRCSSMPHASKIWSRHLDHLCFACSANAASGNSLP